MKTSEVLYKAADVIRANGWTRGHYENDSGAVCLIGACRAASGQSVNALENGEVGRALFMVTATLPIDFNDEHCETIDDACAALEIAADIACANGD